MRTGQCLRFIVVNFSHLEAGVIGENQYPVPFSYIILHLIQISAQVLPGIERDGEGYTANIFWATWHQFKDNVLCWLFKIYLPLPRTIALLLPNRYLCCALPLCTHAISELIRELQTLICFRRGQGIVQLQSGAGSENGQACTPPSCGMSDTNPGHR